MDREGKWQGQLLYTSGLTGPMPMMPASRNEFYLWVSAVDESRPYVRVQNGRYGDTVVIRPKWTQRPEAFTRCTSPTTMSDFFIPYYAMLSPVITPRGEVLSGQPWQHRLVFLNSKSDTIRVAERVTAPVPITDSEWKVVEADLESLRASNPQSTCGTLTRATTKDPVRRFVVDGEGRLWVETATGNGLAFDVFSEDGRLLAEVPLPGWDYRTSVTTVAAQKGWLALTVRDPDGIYKVWLYRVPGAAKR
jgi:hypothetical protein